ncbi:MAG: hydrogenase [Lentisphaerae bacterium]|nr:hydrogenase [Lentisphaerota bacterium]
MNTSFILWLGGVILSLVFCPLFPGIVNKVKARLVGCTGASIWQLYYDLFKLLQRGSVYSRTTTWILQMAPLLSLAALLTGMLFLPFAFADSPLAFNGDVVLFFYLMAMSRLFSVRAALDTGSSFAGMGASREMQFATLAEIGLFCIIAFLVLLTGHFSLSGLLNGFGTSAWTFSGAAMLLVAIAFFILMLMENCRVPFDDPDTHLELTMIHEAMILDYGGPDLALIHYAAALKLWLFSAIWVLMMTPAGLFSGLSGLLVFFVTQILVAVLLGVVESITARFRFLKVPQLLLGVPALALMAIILMLVFQ